MKLVPLEEEDEEEEENPWTQEMRRSQQKMKKVLADKKLTTRQRARHHAGEFGKYLVFRKKRQQERGGKYFLTAASEAEAEDHLGPTAKEVVEKMPAEHRGRAARVLEKLQEHRIVTWNPKGNVFVDGVQVPRANLTRLIREVVVKEGASRRKPIGWERFVSAMAESDVLVPSAVDEWEGEIGLEEPNTPEEFRSETAASVYPPFTEEERRSHGAVGIRDELREQRRKEQQVWQELGE